MGVPFHWKSKVEHLTIREIESGLPPVKEPIKKTFLHRTITFSMSGTYLVDLKN